MLRNIVGVGRHMLHALANHVAYALQILLRLLYRQQIGQRLNENQQQMERLARELGQVDAKAVHGFARSQFDPNRLLVVLVGDRKVVMPQLRKVKALKGVDLLEVDATGVVKQQGKL